MPGTRASMYPCGRLSMSARFIFKDMGPPRVICLFVYSASTLEVTEVEKPLPHPPSSMKTSSLSF